MNLLAIDSSSKVASCALLSGERLLGEVYLDAGLVHSTTLAPMVKHLLDLSSFNIKDVDLFCVSNGPGSFTGVRIGVSLVKGMALALGKKTLGVSTLYSMAFNAIDLKDAIICPCMDARKNQLYTAIFNLENLKITRITEDTAIGCEGLFSKLLEYKNINIILAGDGADLFFNFVKEKGVSLNSKIRILSHGYRYQTAKNVAFAALNLLEKGEKTVKPKDLGINYLRPSQAEISNNLFIS